MSSQTVGEHPLVIAPGVYRVSQIAETFRVSRSSINRYIAKLNIPVGDVEYQGKFVKGVSVDEAAIRGIEQLVNQGCGQSLTGLVNHGLSDNDGEQSMDNHLFRSDLLEAKSKLEEARQKIDDLNAKLIDQKAMYERLIDSNNKLIKSKESEITTLKTSMVMIEQLKRYGALDATTSKPGPLARLGQWLNGFKKPSKPAATYQQIDPLVES